jgi:hypothetical protein
MITKILDELRLFLKLETYSQQYARKSGLKIVKVKNVGVDLYCDDELLYYPNACAGVSR